MYEGEVFTYRNKNGSAPRSTATNRQQPPEGLAGSERAVRIEVRLARLEENLADLSGAVQHLTEALEAQEDLASARANRAPEPDYSPREVPVETPKVTVQMQTLPPERPAAPPSGDVKVSLFAGGSTEAILGHVRVTQQS